MTYPEKVTDLKPDQLVSAPVVLIDYDLLKGCPVEVINAVHDFVDAYENAGGGVVPRERPYPVRSLQVPRDQRVGHQGEQAPDPPPQGRLTDQ